MAKKQISSVEYYSRVESDAKPILEKMTCITPYIPDYYSYDRMIFSQYLAMQFTRTKGFRRKSQLMYDHSFKRMLILNLINKKTPLNEKEIQFINNPHQFGEFCQSQDTLSLHELEFADRIEQFFRFRPWVIIAFEKPTLITSDSPIYLLPNKEVFPGNGLSTAIEYWFPLDNSHLLIMSDPLCLYPIYPDKVIYQNKSSMINNVLKQYGQSSNDAQIANCHMEAYGQKSILQKYEGKTLRKRPPFHIGENNSFNSYYNNAEMDLEPILGHGEPISEVFAKK